MKIRPEIRFISKDDVPQLVQLCMLHASYEKADYSLEGKAQRLESDLFGKNPKLHCLVLESDGFLLGYTTYMKQYATWDAAEYIYLDCLFIKEFARGLGFGEKLVNRIKLEGQKLGCGLIQWQTPDFNTRAIKFYRRIGAISKSKERFFLKI